MFKDQDMGMLNIIGCLKQTGMSIKDIKTFVNYYESGDDDFNKRMNIIENQEKLVQLQMENLQKNLNMLEYKKWYYTKAKQLGSLDNVEKLPKTDIPKMFHKFLTK